MRIGVDGRPLKAPFTGIGVYTREILERLAINHDLFIYLDRECDWNGTIKGNVRWGPSRRWTGVATANFAFARWASQDRVDIFFSPRHHLPLALGDMPTVVTIHDLVWRVAPETMKPFNRLLDATLMPLALARADRVIAVSQDTADRIAAYCGRRDVAVVHNGARAMSAEIPFGHPRPYFLLVGTKEPRKNVAGTIDGFLRAVAHGLGDHDLVLVGAQGWGRSELSAIDACLPGADHVLDLGPVTGERLAGLYDSCVALVLASFYEGFGIPLAEAMRHGKPIITSGFGAMAEVAGNSALLVDPANPASIARAFLRLARDRPTRERLATNARRRAGQFNWDRAAQETAEVLAAAAAPKMRRYPAA